MRVVCKVCRDGGGGEFPPYNCDTCGSRKTKLEGVNQWVLPPSHYFTPACWCEDCSVYFQKSGTITISLAELGSKVNFRRNDLAMDFEVDLSEEEELFIRFIVSIGLVAGQSMTYNITSFLYLLGVMSEKYNAKNPKSSIDPGSIERKIKARLA